MKKKFLNNAREFCLFVLVFIGTIAESSLMFVSSNPYTLTAYVIWIVLFGSIEIFWIIALCHAFEVIVFYEDKVISVKLFRRTEILYDEISSVTPKVIDGLYSTILDTWEIADSNGKAIYVTISKRKEKYIKQIEKIINYKTEGLEQDET